MSSSPDHDMSESSRSPTSTYEYYSSPSQQVPELTNGLTGLSCVDNANMPYLKITEQPQNYFRFRYVSEMVGTHGCLLGKSSASNKTKTHPSVELRNFNGCASITCQLAQNTNPNEHPHKLLVEEQEEDSEVSYTVPERGSYKVAFAGMGIIHTAKKDVPELLFRRSMEKYKLAKVDTKELETKCQAMAKTIDLNIVRLKFSAYDVVTGKEICKPVFSEPIHNMKSASTNDLKICRMSKGTGRPRGGDDVFIFVEKVNKKNIQIWFYEEDENGRTCWEAQGIFMQSDVHHQYGIVFRTPAYVEQNISKDVVVFVKLVRPSDGRCSEPKTFKYKAEPTYRNNKKRKMGTPYSSLTSSSGSGSINSITNVPATVLNEEQVPEFKTEAEETFQFLPTVDFQSPSQCELGDAFLGTEVPKQSSPMWCEPNAIAMGAPPPLPNLQLDSTELNKLLQGSIPSESHPNFMDYLSSLESTELSEFAGLNHMRYLQMLQTDSPEKLRYQGGASEDVSTVKKTPQKSHRASGSSEEIHNDAFYISCDDNEAKKFAGDHQINYLQKLQSDSPKYQNRKTITMETDAKEKVTPKKQQTSGSSEKKEDGYTAFYKSQDGYEVKELINELYELMSNKSNCKTQDVKDKLERLFDIRLSNGDTFLHMTLCSNTPSFKNIVKIIHSVNMSHLFDYYNKKHQTVLHVAIAYDMYKIVPLLIANGCNPMMKDQEGDTAVHYAVRSQSCLKPLLQAIRQYKVACDLDDYNDEKQTALHICTSEASVRLLVQHGASCRTRDAQGRLPLHIAAYDNNLPVMQALLDYTDTNEVDVLDGGGNTALQIVCDGPQRKNATAMVRLLLEKKADPMKQEKHTETAWSRARDKPAIREIMKWYIPSTLHGGGIKPELDDAIKSEPEDDYESADDSEASALPELSAYEHELSAVLDRTGGWRTLAAHLRLEHSAWYSAQPSATRTLLKYIKECREMSSESLVLVLQDIGEVEAADIVKRYIY